MNARPDDLVSIDNLVTTFTTSRGGVRAVDGIDLSVRKGEVVCIVGESGSGKSVTGLSLMRLIEPSTAVQAERITFDGRDLLALPEPAMNGLRGKDISMIFQEPMTALNPSRRVGDQIAEVLRVHTDLSASASMQRAVELLGEVGIVEPQLRARAYPHQLSGGQRQRVVIAIAIACSPKLIIADEPTTALDVTVQAQVLDLLLDLRERLRCALLFITHDLGVVAEIADRVVVLYAGQVVEEAPVDALFRSPGHPYTEGLLACVPDVDAPRSRERQLPAIPGVVPNPAEIGGGCRFRERCPKAFGRCTEMPPLIDIGAERRARCWLHAA